jgi:hypothetical protein
MKFKNVSGNFHKQIENYENFGVQSWIPRFWLSNLKLFLKTVYNFYLGTKFKIPPR